MVLLGIGAVSFFVWLLIPDRTHPRRSELIDPSDSRQLGMLIGMAGGSIGDAATARFALQRFEEIHGRKATTRDIGIVIGLLNS